MSYRVLICVSSKSSLYNQVWEQPQVIVQTALQHLEESEKYPPGTDSEARQPRILLIERNYRNCIIFDIFHPTYDPEQAHLYEHNQLPVFAVFIDGKNSYTIKEGLSLESPLRKLVNKRIQRQHNLEGYGSQPPFRVDYADGKTPIYYNARMKISCEDEGAKLG